MSKKTNDIEHVRNEVKAKLLEDGFVEDDYFAIITELCVYRIMHSPSLFSPMKLIDCYEGMASQASTINSIKTKVNQGFRKVSATRKANGLSGFTVNGYTAKLVFDMGGGATLANNGVDELVPRQSLKACPLCGAAAVFHREMNSCKISCSSCFLVTPSFKTAKECIFFWNRRTDS